MSKTNIATYMVIAGHKKYYEYAYYAVNSFLTNNEGHDLFLLVDKPKAIKEFSHPNLKVIDYGKLLMNVEVPVLHQVESNVKPSMVGLEYFDRVHNQLFIADSIPCIESFLHGLGYTHVLRLDIDSLFIGNIFDRLIPEIERDEEVAVWWVERSDPAMFTRAEKAYKFGAGFTLWRHGGPFVPFYLEYFKDDEQETMVHNIYPRNDIKCRLLKHPGYHFVYPFKKNPAFDRETAKKFIPAYFHFTGNDLEAKQAKVWGWFHD